MIVPKILSIICAVVSFVCCALGDTIPSRVRDILLFWLSAICFQLVCFVV